MVNLWHDVPKERITPEDFLAVIEISQGSKNKYELDKQTGALILDRILYTATHYPHNYGFIPHTLSEDGDPLDVLVISSEPVLPLSMTHCKPIGILEMVDNGALDEKIIAVIPSDPLYSGYNDINQLPEHVTEEIAHFFRVYKMLERGKYTEVGEMRDHVAAKEAIRKDMANYEKHFPSNI